MEDLQFSPGQPDVEWREACARRLREHWPELGLVTLIRAAEQLGNDPELAGLTGPGAAERWLDRARAPRQAALGT